MPDPKDKEAVEIMLYQTEPEARKGKPNGDNLRLYLIDDKQGPSPAGLWAWAGGPRQVADAYLESLGVRIELVDGKRKVGLVSKLRALLRQGPPKGKDAAAHYQQTLIALLAEEESKRSGQTTQTEEVEDEVEPEADEEPEPQPEPVAAPPAPKKRGRPPKAVIPAPLPDDEEEQAQPEEEAEDEEPTANFTPDKTGSGKRRRVRQPEPVPPQPEEDDEWREDEGEDDEEDSPKGSIDDVDDFDGDIPDDSPVDW